MTAARSRSRRRPPSRGCSPRRSRPSRPARRATCACWRHSSSRPFLVTTHHTRNNGPTLIRQTTPMSCDFPRVAPWRYATRRARAAPPRGQGRAAGGAACRPRLAAHDGPRVPRLGAGGRVRVGGGVGGGERGGGARRRRRRHLDGRAQRGARSKPAMKRRRIRRRRWLRRGLDKTGCSAAWAATAVVSGASGGEERGARRARAERRHRRVQRAAIAHARRRRARGAQPRQRLLLGKEIGGDAQNALRRSPRLC